MNCFKCSLQPKCAKYIENHWKTPVKSELERQAKLKFDFMVRQRIGEKVCLKSIIIKSKELE